MLLFCLAACAGAKPLPQSASAPLVKVALLPLEDFGEETGGAFQVEGMLGERLPALGYDVVDQASLKRLLLRERVRRTGSVSRALGQAVAQDLGAPLIFVGAVTQYRGGSDPCTSIVARLVEASTGRLVWTGAASADGAQFETVLGLGRIGDPARLTEVVVERLIASLPPAAVLLAPGAEGAAP